MTFESVTKFIVPKHIVQETDRHLRAAGLDQAECFVLWSGVRTLDHFVVKTAHVPRQTAYRLQEGLCVRVDGDELHRINVWLFQHQEQLGVQIHSHPTDAYHSDTDDTYPIVTIRGGLSIVVPDFCRDGLMGKHVAYYRLSSAGWDELSSAEARRLLEYSEGYHVVG